jgi:hypothetical protein
MKKFYLFALLCFCSLLSFGQAVTVYVYATAATGAFITGSSTATTRTDGNIVANGTGASPSRGYAVFNLAAAGIPAGSVIGSVIAGINISTYATGTTTTCNTNIYAGDLSLITSPVTLYADMTTPAATNVSAVTYGAATGNHLIASTAAAVTLVQANLTTKVSYCYTNTGSAVYTITGETGTATTTGAHAPFLEITYCPPPTAVTATATPNPICTGDTLTLTGAATGASGGYTWAGPGSYSAGVISTTMNTPAAGVYTLTAVNSCTTYSATATAYTATVMVNPLPAAIGGGAAVCTGSTTILTDATGAGAWSSSNTAVGTIDPSTGTAGGIMAGTTTITFTLSSTGCKITSTLADNNTPGPVSGPVTVCKGSTIMLTDGSPGGAWTSTAGTGTASVASGTGVVTGTSAGSATINYTIPGCPAATYPITVNPVPATIGGTLNVCQGATTDLTEGTSGGTWSSVNFLVASIGSFSGIVTGLTPGASTISYTLSTGCAATATVLVAAGPDPIMGASSVCPAGAGGTIALTDGSMGGMWSSSNNSIASVTTGIVTGVTTGSATITYKIFPSGCYVTAPITVYPVPAPITGITTFCQNTATVLSDADAGGTWSSSNTAVGSVDGSGDVTGIGSTTAIISYTESYGCYSLAEIFVLTAPVVTVTASGPTTFCTGGTVTLTASGTGMSYQWYAGGSPIPGATDISYTTSSTDPYTVEATNSSNCSTFSTATDVVAGLSPFITSSNPSASFCSGHSTVLTTNIAGITGAVYQWADNGVIIPSATAPTYDANMTGVFSCSVTVSGGSGTCVAVTPPYTVTVFPLPSPVASFNGVALVTASVYTSYQWYRNYVAVPGATSDTWTPVTNGSYMVDVDSNGCPGYSNAVLYTGFINAGVAPVNPASIHIFPNPASNVVHVESPVAVRAVITGIEGKAYIDQQNAKDINIAGLANGLYLILIYDENKNQLVVEKLIKE